MSTQVGHLLGPASATVSGIEGCSPPQSCGWTLALVEARIPSKIVAFLETELLPDGGTLTVRTSDFRGQLLVKGLQYEYALMQTSDPETLADLKLQNPADVDEAEGLGAKVAKSQRFIADYPPLDGMVTMTPQSGFAVTTAFAGSTTGWVDEALENNTFAFYIFPYEQNGTVSADGAGGITVNGTFSHPSVDFTDASSPSFWTKMGGTFLKNISANATAWNVSVAAGVYFTAAVARDPLGAISVAYAPGPVVEVPAGGLSVAEASAAIDAALQSADPGVILGMLDSLTSVPLATNDTAGQEEANAKKFEALKVASDIVETDAGSLQKFGSVVTEVLKSSGTNGSATADAASADQASDALTNVLEAALGATGVDEAAGNALLSSISAVGDSYAAVQTGQAEAAAASRAAKLEVMTSQLGSAALATLPVGASTTLSSLDEKTGKGLEIKVQKEDIGAAVENGITGEGLQIPGNALSGLSGRRLQSGCTTLAVQQTDWVQSNPFGYLNTSVGINLYVPAAATVKVLELKQCDAIVTVPNLAEPIAMTLHLPSAPDPATAPEGYVFEAVCAMLDPLQQAMQHDQGWSTSVTSWFLPTSYTATTVDCLATTLGGAYAGIYLPVPLATATSSSTRTVSATSTGTSTTPPVIEPEPSDTGMVAGTSVASIAFVIVIGLCAWQAYAGNVNLKVNIDTKASCKWMAESVQKAKIRVQPFEPPSGPTRAWEEPSAKPPEEIQPGPHSQRDAQEHFWDWARDLAQSASQPDVSRGSSFGFGQSVAGTPPSIPRPHFPMARQADEKEEYFQSFAQELSDIIGSGVPNAVADAPAMPKTPPPPPPKRPSIADVNPPAPPWSQRRPSLQKSTTPPLPPPMLENAERIDVRVDQAFSDWASDFALCRPPSPTQAKGIPPPPPPRRSAPAQSTLPLPPPRPPSIASGSDTGRPSPPPIPSIRENDPHEWNQLSHRPSFASIPPAKSTDVPRPPPPPIPQGDQPRQPIVPPAPSDRFLGLGPPPLSSAPAQPLLPPPRPSGRLDKPVTPPVMTRGDRPRVPLVPPSVSAVRPGMQLAMPLPKQQPLQPPGVPEGVEDDDLPPRSSSDSEQNASTPREAPDRKSVV